LKVGPRDRGEDIFLAEIQVCEALLPRGHDDVDRKAIEKEVAERKMVRPHDLRAIFAYDSEII
jgi:hypothetical protein